MKQSFVVSVFAVMALLVVLLALGGWQWNRYQYKVCLEAQQQQHVSQRPCPLMSLALHEVTMDMMYRPVLFQGAPLNDYTFLLDNQIVAHRVGFRVLVPFKLRSSNAIVLVDRGWIPGGVTRSKVPTIPEMKQGGFVEGVLWRPAGKAFLLREDTASVGWPKIMQAIDFKKMEQLLGPSLLPWLVILDEGHDGGFHRVLPGASMKAVRHLGYAFQWWSMAAVLLMLCWYWARRGRHEQRCSE